MNEVWQGLRGQSPIVEFHDIRTEPGRAGRYLELAEGPLGDAYARNGGALLGQFRVDLHQERVILLRGFGDMIARRQALGRFHASPAWTRHRAEMAGLVREHSVTLTRAVAPSSGTRPLRYGEGYTLMISELRFAEQVGDYHLWLRLMLRKAGLDPVAAFATLESINDVPAVPVIKNRIMWRCCSRARACRNCPRSSRECCAIRRKSCAFSRRLRWCGDKRRVLDHYARPETAAGIVGE